MDKQKLISLVAEIRERLDSVEAELVKDDFQPASEIKPETVEPVDPLYDYPPTREDLEAVLGTVFDSDLEITGNGTVKTRKFLKDMWKGYDDKLKSLGYGWFSDAESKTYEWRYGYKKEGQQELSSSTSPTITPVAVKVDEIDWKTKDKDGNTVEARSGEKAWAFVKGYDRASQKQTDEPKKSCESLYNWLKSHKDYNDGSYVYTMNKDETFFNRKPVE